MSAAPWSRVAFLLPVWRTCVGARPSADLAKALGRADLRPIQRSGAQAQCARHFVAVPDHASAAAYTRQIDAGDAAGASWLRVDPAHLRADISHARLLGTGATLSLTMEDAQALLPALRPIFGDAGFEIDAPVAERWYLRAAPQTRFPAFSTPDEALGEDVFEHRIEGEDVKRWRRLDSEVQIALHHHPWNIERARRGLVAINALWFWGGGALPVQTKTAYDAVFSNDPLLRAMAIHAGAAVVALPQRFDAALTTDASNVLFDLRWVRRFSDWEHTWLAPITAALRKDQVRTLVLDAEDRDGYVLQPWQRWRFWRKPWKAPE